MKSKQSSYLISSSAQNIISDWLHELNMKKLKQHEERGENYDSYIPVSVMKK